MNSGLSDFKEMLELPTATTKRFHEVMSGLNPDNSEEELLAREYMEYLLHLPENGAPVHWQEKVTGYMRIGLISTITVNEIIQVLKPGEKRPLPDWEVLADRVVLNIKNDDWRLLSIERHKMLIDYLKKSAKP